MAKVRLENVYKIYPNGVKAVKDFSLNIQDEEFVVFVGPSGCGKSTTLRMIAGLEDISAGRIYIDDAVVNDLEPKDRDISMVFQNYALFPTMTVEKNILCGIRTGSRTEKKETLAALVAYLKRQNLVEQFARFAEREGLKRRNRMIAASRKLIENYLMNGIIYDVLDLGAAVEYSNSNDPFMERALEALNEKNATRQSK